MKTLLTFTSLLLLVTMCTGQSTAPYKIIRRLPIHSAGGWDYISVDQAHHRIYVSHGNQVNVLDESTGDSVGFIPHTLGVHGIAFVQDKNEGYISAGRLNTVITFDLNTLQVKDSIPVGKNPDAIFYDEVQKKIVTCNGTSHDASFIDVKNDQLSFTLPLGGKPETAVSDGKGKIFVNLEDKNEVLELDAVHPAILRHFTLRGGEEPTGLSIDLKTNRLMVSCGNKMMVILDSKTGKKVAQVPTGDGTDGNAFDPNTRLVFSSNGEGTLTVIREVNANQFVVLQTIATEKGARTIAINTDNHHVYLPSADFGPTATGQRRAPMIPGTFRVLDLAR